MRVQVENIKEAGLTLDEPVPQQLLTDALSGGRDTGFRANGPSRLQATFNKLSGGVLVNGKLIADVTAACNRCLADVSVKLPVDFTLNLVPRDKLPGAGDEAEDDDESRIAGSFELDDADEELFDGKTIDLDPIVREQVLLALPMHVVCKDDCKGLCAQCGQNLNEKQCSCEPKSVDPRLAALKNIKLKPN